MQYNKIAGGFATFPAPSIQGLPNAQHQQHPPSTPAGSTTPAPAAASFPPPSAPQLGAAPLTPTNSRTRRPSPPSAADSALGGASALASTLPISGRG